MKDQSQIYCTPYKCCAHLKPGSCCIFQRKRHQGSRSTSDGDGARGVWVRLLSRVLWENYGCDQSWWRAKRDHYFRRYSRSSKRLYVLVHPRFTALKNIKYIWYTNSSAEHGAKVRFPVVYLSARFMTGDSVLSLSVVLHRYKTADAQVWNYCRNGKVIIQGKNMLN